MPQVNLNRWDMYVAFFWWGANCGPVALAAILGVSLGDVRRLAPEFAENRRRMTVEMVQSAIRRAGRDSRIVGARYPSHGLAFVQTDGATVGHIIAVSGAKMLDTFSLDLFGGWRSLSGWERANRKYRIACGIEVDRC